MKLKTGITIGVSACCLLGFGIGVRAASNEQGYGIDEQGYHHHQEAAPCYQRNHQTAEETECIFGHQDCDGTQEGYHHQDMQNHHQTSQRCH